MILPLHMVCDGKMKQRISNLPNGQPRRAGLGRRKVMLRKILAGVFGFASSKSGSATPTQQREETLIIQPKLEPKFLFPDTLTEWRVAVQQLRQERATLITHLSQHQK